MKKLIIAVSLTMITLCCKAQEIIPLEKLIEFRDSQTDIADGTYLKDVNGLLNKYLGTWKGTYNNKNYTFIVTKTKLDVLGVFVDKLLVRYLITTTTGLVLEDTRTLTDTNLLVIEGDYLSNDKKYYVLNYFGKNTTCGQSGEVFISTITSSGNKQMKLFLAPYQDLIDRSVCPTLATQILPTKSMILTKQ